jgi:hypothetical protein
VLVHIFKGIGRVYGFTENPTGANLPSWYGPWKTFKTIDVRRDLPTIGLDAGECLDDLERYGFYITDAHVRITASIPNWQTKD